MVKICLVNAATHRSAVQLDHRADRHPARIQSALNQRVVSSLLRQTGGRLFALSFLPLIRIINYYSIGGHTMPKPTPFQYQKRPSHPTPCHGSQFMPLLGMSPNSYMRLCRKTFQRSIKSKTLFDAKPDRPLIYSACPSGSYCGSVDAGSSGGRRAVLPLPCNYRPPARLLAESVAFSLP